MATLPQPQLCERCDAQMTDPDETFCDDCLCQLADEEYEEYEEQSHS